MKRKNILPELELWKEYKKTKNIKIRNYFIKKYYPDVKNIARKINSQKPYYIELCDLVGYGIFGLIKAIEKFDLDKNIKFKTFAYYKIKGAIFDELRMIDWIPRHTKLKKMKTKKIKQLSFDQPDTLTIEDIIEKKEIKKYIKMKIEQLPFIEKKIIILYHFENLKQKEIAEVLKMANCTVSKIYNKALKNLKKIIMKEMLYVKQ